MGVTPNGLPYPESTEDLRDGAAAIQALAEAVDLPGTYGPVDPAPVLFTAGATYLGNGYAATTFVRDDGSVGMHNTAPAATPRAHDSRCPIRYRLCRQPIRGVGVAPDLEQQGA